MTNPEYFDQRLKQTYTAIIKKGIKASIESAGPGGPYYIDVPVENSDRTLIIGYVDDDMPLQFTLQKNDGSHVLNAGDVNVGDEPDAVANWTVGFLDGEQRENDTLIKPIPIYEHGQIPYDDIPDVVRASLVKWSRRHNLIPRFVLDALRYDTMNGCYAFTYRGMFYGVEKADGYIHT